MISMYIENIGRHESILEVEYSLSNYTLKLLEDMERVLISSKPLFKKL